MDWIAFLDKWQDLTGAVVGGVIGGIVTFLGLWWTFRHQSKNEYPKKLIMTTKIASDLREYYVQLDWYIFHLEQALKKEEQEEYEEIKNLSLRRLREKLLIKAANVDKETYRLITTAFDLIESDKAFIRIFFTNDKTVIAKAVELRDDHIDKLGKEIDKRIEFYEKKI